MYFFLLSKALKPCIYKYRALSQEIQVTTISFRDSILEA